MALTVPHLGLLALTLLFLAGFSAGLIDAIAGGGGLISLPVLLNLGFPPPLALATNKLQGTFGSVTAMAHFWRGGVVRFSECWVGMVWTGIGSFFGAWCVQHVDPALMGRLIPWLLAVILAYVMFKPELGKEASEPRMTRGLFYFAMGLTLGFYDGFFGPGVGSLWTVAWVVLAGLDFVRAAGHARTMNAASNVVSLGLFISKGQVVWGAGLVMAAGQFAGSRLGAGLAMKKGSRFVKPLFLMMVCLTLARLIWVNYLR